MTAIRKRKNMELSCILHDLKTPIYSQKKILELFLDNSLGFISPQQRKILTEVLKSTEYLQNLVSDLISANLFESNQTKLNKEKFLWKEFIEDILREVFVLYLKNQLYFEIQDASLYADKLQIKRVVINLISNAIKYSSSKSKIYISSKVLDKEMVFSVTNKSSYPLPMYLEKFYDKFNNKYGSGLGLYIVKKIIVKHSGKVFAEKDKENNCTFGFKIPLYQEI